MCIHFTQLVANPLFRDELESGLCLSSDCSKGGRPPYDSVLMFKILILQSLYNLSDDQIEFQIKDRLSFMRFLELQLWDKIPDAKTVWLYRERLKQQGLNTKLFGTFDQLLNYWLLVLRKRKIVENTRGINTLKALWFL